MRQLLIRRSLAPLREVLPDNHAEVSTNWRFAAFFRLGHAGGLKTPLVSRFLPWYGFLQVRLHIFHKDSRP
jgi:hypothetical protein